MSQLTFGVLFLLCCFNSGVFCQNDGSEPEVIDMKNLPPLPILRNTLLDSENEVDSFNGYHYDRPEIPFGDTNVSPVEVEGYSYPKPLNPLTFPDRALTNNVQEEVSPNVTPESDQGSPINDLPDDTKGILDSEVVAVEDDPQDGSSNGN